MISVLIIKKLKNNELFKMEKTWEWLWENGRSIPHLKSL